MKKILRAAIVTVMAVSLFVGLVGNVAGVSAQDSAAGNGIKLSPVRSDITMNPGESRSIKLTVQNITNSTAEFQAIVNDMIAKGEDGKPALILEDDKYAPSHSLKRYVSDIPNVTIEAGKSKQVTATITIPSNAAAGGYYGAIRFVPAGSGINKNVTLSASVASIVLIRVNGDIKEDTTIKSFDVRNGRREDASASKLFFTNKDLYAWVRFENKGNSHVQPYGKVTLKKGDTILQMSEINDTTPRGNVLPDSVRRFYVELDKVGLWGKYTIEGNFGYGTSGQLLTATSTFYVISLWPILLGVGLITLIVLAIIFIPRAIKRYNQNVIKRANRRK